MPLQNCETCGKPISANAVSCPHCGETLQKRQRSTRHSKSYNIKTVAVCLFVVLALILFVYIKNKYKAPQSREEIEKIMKEYVSKYGIFYDKEPKLQSSLEKKSAGTKQTIKNIYPDPTEKVFPENIENLVRRDMELRSTPGFSFRYGVPGQESAVIFDVLHGYGLCFSPAWIFTSSYTMDSIDSFWHRCYSTERLDKRSCHNRGVIFRKAAELRDAALPPFEAFNALKYLYKDDFGPGLDKQFVKNTIHTIYFAPEYKNLKGDVLEAYIKQNCLNTPNVGQ